ncbi:tRNA (5-methylaminomethyl-2-thiouridine)(34)-methyltransferase MnmD [Phenylobacterium sp.]|uniref:tRNA (5-methylaminomethyl-2-thiouridine)(34)-methyltransferase MnmD n=1 Tax=Phenylobacterium sp. TaxID=1871053 RepID=UPI00286D68B6|nr:tRNA (5-methylaminomethyl-2-thiouridine)(34)-methyltransferase MnmD [Phenylobacterium sp.]
MSDAAQPPPPQGNADEPPIGSPLVWTADGQPRSRLYDDVYFSAEDGLAEARAVFLAGCGLPDAWQGRRRFVVGELGFGTGLNGLALIDLWSRTRPPDGRLHIFSVEAHPLVVAEARRALARWPELAPLAERLLAAWPGRASGVHRLEFADLGVILDVAAGEAATALDAWSGRADAWFLDGFSPARNPAMWRDEVLALVAARSAPGAVAATFTVAGAVRRGLAEAGFAVARAPGFGRKRQRLTAWLPGAAERPAPVRRVAIIGAGIAGASAARAVRTLGGEAVVYDAEGRGAGGSGNPAALVTPRLDAGLDTPARIFAQAFRRAVALYAEEPAAIIARGHLQLAFQPRDVARFARIAASDLFEPGALEMLTPQATAARLGEAAPTALAQHAALVIEPGLILAAWAPEVVQAKVHDLRRDDDGWSLLDVEGATLGRADAVIVTAALASAALIPDLPLAAVRGQVSLVAAPVAPPPPTAFGGYVIPTRSGLLFGATNDRGDQARDLRAGDHARNLASLAEGLPGLAAQLAGRPLEGRAAIRAVTPDYLPLAGAAAGGRPGLFVLAGFGARGFTLAPLLAEHVAALALAAPSPLARPLAQAVDPARFARRAARRGSYAPGLIYIRAARGTSEDRPMQTKLVLTAMAAVLSVAVGETPALAKAPAQTRPNACFWTRSADGFAAQGDRVVNVRVGVNDVYRFEMMGSCPDIDWSDRIALVSRSGSTICTGMDAEIVTRTAIGPQRCPVRSTRKLTREEVAALPRGARP